MSMNGMDKVELISAIGRKLQERYTFSDLNNLLKTYGVAVIDNPIKKYNSKWVYVKDLLPEYSDELVLSLAKDLEIEHPVLLTETNVVLAEHDFWRPGYFKLFISHLATYKEKVGELKKSLLDFGISGFVAHDDIQPSKEWLREIENALKSMDALCAVLMPGFKDSQWTDQEIGAAIGRDLFIIPIKKGLDPYGFIGKYQAMNAHGRTVKQVAEGIFQLLIESPKTKNKITLVIADQIVASGLPEKAIHWINLLKQIEAIPKSLLEQLREKIVALNHFNDNAFISQLNELLHKYDIEQVLSAHFNIFEPEIEDDLPF